jgi:hypothetical protein
VLASKSTWPKASFASVSTIKAMQHYRLFCNQAEIKPKYGVGMLTSN